MEDNLNGWTKWKTTSMEDTLNRRWFIIQREGMVTFFLYFPIWCLIYTLYLLRFTLDIKNKMSYKYGHFILFTFLYLK